MSDDSTEWQPQQPPAVGLASERSSSIGWRHNIPGSLNLCRKRAGSDGGKESTRPTFTRNTLGLRKKGTRALRSGSTHNDNDEKNQVTSPAPQRQDGLRQHPVTVHQQIMDRYQARSKSLEDVNGPKPTYPVQAATPPTKRRIGQNDFTAPQHQPPGTGAVPRVPDMTAALANRAMVEKARQMQPSEGHDGGLVECQTQTVERPREPTRLHQREAGRYAAAMTKAQLLSVIPERDGERSSTITSVSDSALPLSLIATFKLCTPTDSPETPNSPSPWDSAGPHERFVDGIEFEMLDAHSGQPPASAPASFSNGSLMLVSPVSISPLVQRSATTAPQATSPESPSAHPISPYDMAIDPSSYIIVSPRQATLSSSRASSMVLPESMMPGISRRLSEASTGSRITININGTSIKVPRVPPPPPPKTPGPPMTMTPDLPNKASQRLKRVKSFSAMPPSCPKGSLPRPVSKYNPQVSTDLGSLGEVPAIPQIFADAIAKPASHTPSSSVSSNTSSSVMSPMDKISRAISGSPKPIPRPVPRESSPKDISPGSVLPQEASPSGDSPKVDLPRITGPPKPITGAWRALTDLPHPGPPPARPPPPPPLQLAGLGIEDTPAVSKTNPATRSPSPDSDIFPIQSNVSPSRKASIPHSLKRQSSSSDKDGLKSTDAVKKIDSGLEKPVEGAVVLERTKSEVRRRVVKKMALDNIGAVKIREPSRSPQKSKKKVEREPSPLSPHASSPKISNKRSPKPSSPSSATQKPQSRLTMLRIQADEQDKINSLNIELTRLQEQCSEAKRHHEALHVARQRLFNDFPDNNRKSISSVYFDDAESSNGSGPPIPGKEEALADIDDKIRKWKREMQQNEHKRNRIQKKLAWHSTDRLAVVPLPVRRTPSPSRYQVRTPRVVTPITARSCSSGYTITIADLDPVPTLPTPKTNAAVEIPDKMPELDDGRRPSIDSTASLITPPQSPLTRSNEPWIGLESPFTPFLDTPTQAASRVDALNVRHTGEGVSSGLRSPEPREDRQITIQVFANSDITDLMTSLQDEIDTLSRRVRI